MDYKEKLYNIIGACMEVHKELRPGLKEPVYQEALMYELQDRGIPFQREVHVPIQYKGHTLEQHYQLDFLCYGDVVVELKATEGIIPDFRNQLFTYLRVTKHPYGVLVNFGEKSLHVERYSYDAQTGKIEGFAK